MVSQCRLKYLLTSAKFWNMLKHVQSFGNKIELNKFCCKLINSARRIGFIFRREVMLATEARELLHDRIQPLNHWVPTCSIFFFFFFLILHIHVPRGEKKSLLINRCKNSFLSFQLYTKVTRRALSQRKDRSNDKRSSWPRISWNSRYYTQLQLMWCVPCELFHFSL